MSNMTVEEYADYQMLWSVVGLTQPVISLGGQNRMRLRNIPESLVPFIIQSIILATPILLISIYRNFYPVSVFAGLVVTIVSYVIAFLETQKKLSQSSLFKLSWLLVSSITTLLFLKYFSYNSRVYSTIVIGFVTIIYSSLFIVQYKFSSVDWKTPWKFNQDLYGIELSLLFIIFNVVLTHNRNQLSYSYTPELITLSTTGYFIMNLIVFASRPVVLLSELGVKGKRFLRQKIVDFWPVIVSIFVLFFFPILRIVFFSDAAYSIEIINYIPWIAFGCIRSYLDIFTPLIYKKWRLIIAGVLFVITYGIALLLLNSSDNSLGLSFLVAFIYVISRYNTK